MTARDGTDPWRRAPVGELQDQVLPRWFVVLCIAMVPIAMLAAVAAFVVFRGEEQPLAARRPPPAAGLTTAVGDFNVGTAEPVLWQEPCADLVGVGIAGTVADREALATGLAALCQAQLPDDVAARLGEFAAAGGVVRFAQFQATGVDSTADLAAEPPIVLVNARFQRTDPRWIAPLVAHDTTFLDADPATADGALAARQAEVAVCEAALSDVRSSRGCTDAAALLALDDPPAALRDAGFQ